MASWTEDRWLPAALNTGWIYCDRVSAAADGVAAFYASQYRHSVLAEWQARLLAGEIHRNGLRLWEETPLRAGDQLAWHRPPWREEAVPACWPVVHDDGDLHVIDKPAGLPVLPAGGWLEHTVLRVLERRHRADPRGVPRPVHRLGRFTSGLLVCARRSSTRRWLSGRLRESTAALSQDPGPGAGWPPASLCQTVSLCQKVYLALLTPGGLPATLHPGEPWPIPLPIGQRPHPRLGRIWCAVDGEQPGDVAAFSTLTLLERDPAGDRVAVAITSGRPHQIRIHCAAIGAPLLGDQLYLPGGQARQDGLPGDGGYHLRAQRLALPRPDGSWLRLEVAPRWSSSRGALAG
jgi:23S rRNA pseudouridine1911/1915/1917 synthase